MGYNVRSRPEGNHEVKEQEIPLKTQKSNANASDGTSSTKESQNFKDQELNNKKKKSAAGGEIVKSKKKVVKKSEGGKKKVKKRYIPPIVFNCLCKNFS